MQVIASDKLTFEEMHAQAMRNIQALNERPELLSIGRTILQTLFSTLPPPMKMLRARSLAADLSDLTTPYSACKSGCSHCCHIAVTITDLEAADIARYSGRKADNMKPKARSVEAQRAKYHRVPCPFLVEGRCSIYAVRPVACRLAFNMADIPQACDTAESAQVPYLNMGQIHDAFAYAFRKSRWGDIRDFFKPGMSNEQ